MIDLDATEQQPQSGDDLADEHRREAELGQRRMFRQDEVGQADQHHQHRGGNAEHGLRLRQIGRLQEQAEEQDGAAAEEQGRGVEEDKMAVARQRRQRLPLFHGAAGAVEGGVDPQLFEAVDEGDRADEGFAESEQQGHLRQALVDRLHCDIQAVG
ncbi:hypothetical protein QC826_14250 [Rugamonas sp. DEMB1]|nr:hypothetical protein [Rugamonas sp. DEMB1]WGG53164.1 hypothetical protein QC826_14250 [Rugamonas sp. DEMB1]